MYILLDSFDLMFNDRFETKEEAEESMKDHQGEFAIAEVNEVIKNTVKQEVVSREQERIPVKEYLESKEIGDETGIPL